MAAIQRVVSVASEGGSYTNRVADLRGHETWADEPADKGGADRGFNPFELVAAGLGACTSITLLMYAKNRNLALRDVAVKVRYLRAGEEGLVADRVERDIRLIGSLDEAAVEKLRSIAQRCPVHQMLEKAVAIVDTVAIEN